MAKGTKGNETRIPVAEALRRRNTDTEYDMLPTDFAGTVLKVEKGSQPDISITDRGRLIRAAATFYTRKVFLDGRSAVQGRREALIKGLASRHEGIRGVVSRSRGFVVNVFPKSTIDWDQAGLRTALGVSYPAVVAEDLGVSLTVPLEYPTNQGPLTSEIAKRAVRLGFLAIGFKEEDLPEVVETKTTLRVDEGKLHDMVQGGQVDVEKAGVAMETWAIKAEALKHT